MSGLSYLEFHLLFVLPPIVLLLLVVRPPDPPRRGVARLGITLMATVALLYTTPWDNYLIDRGVWWYGPGDVIYRFGSAPVEEYFFFIAQPVLTGLWLYVVGFSPTYRPGDFARRPRLVGAGLFGGLAALGIVCFSIPGGYYLGAILVWACPVLALQWAVGGAYLRRTWRSWSVAVAVPTVYLWIIDRTAIARGVWTISDAHSLGIDPFGLPVEEAVFFLVTNLLVVYGLVLFEWVNDYWRSVPASWGWRVRERWG